MEKTKAKLKIIMDRFGPELTKHPKKLKAVLLDYQVPKNDTHLLSSITQVPYFESFLERLDKDDIAAMQMLFHHTIEIYHFADQSVKDAIDCFLYAFGKKAVEWPKDEAVLGEEYKLIADTIRTMIDKG